MFRNSKVKIMVLQITKKYRNFVAQIEFLHYENRFTFLRQRA